MHSQIPTSIESLQWANLRTEKGKEEDEGEKPVQIIGEDDTGEEVVEVPVPKVLKAIEALAGISSTTTPRGLLLRPSLRGSSAPL